MRYIGGKSMLLDNISNTIKSEAADVSSIIDLFAGSGVVSEYFKKTGFRTISNDFLFFSYVIQRGTVGLNAKPTFHKLGITNPLDYLNSLKIANTHFDYEQCFVYNNYAPVGNCKRMYFQPDNALKIDIIRLTIEEWHNKAMIDEDEYFYLLACLINAVPYISNITGVYAAYLKFWDIRTYNDLTLTEPTIYNNGQSNECFNKEYTILLDMEADLLYADPPYNSREYLPNYHILETIARYDYPQIHGVTGIREYDSQKSAFCKKKTVESAFETLIRDCKSKYILISYNNEALLSTERLTEICQEYAVDNSFRLLEYDYRRYKNKIPNNTAGLKEQLYFLRRY